MRPTARTTCRARRRAQRTARSWAPAAHTCGGFPALAESSRRLSRCLLPQVDEKLRGLFEGAEQVRVAFGECLVLHPIDDVVERLNVVEELGVAHETEAVAHV